MSAGAHRKGRRQAGAGLVSISLVALLVSGCLGRSPRPEFYALSPANAAAAAAPLASRPDLGLAVGPLELPRYLDRPELVSRDGAHALALSDTARWGGSLRSEILRVVADDLGALLGTARVAVYPAEPRFAADWRVLLDVRELGGAPGQPVRLRAGWTLVPGAAGRPPIVDETVAEEPVASASAEDYVAAQSAALGRMSREIAERIAASAAR
jgi:hypothetical protein